MGLFGGDGGNEVFEVILRAREEGLTHTLEQTDHSLERTAERVKRLAEAFLIFEGARKALDVFKDINRAAAQQQADFTKIRLSLKDAGESYRGYGKIVQETIQKTAVAHGFSVKDMAQGFVRLEAVTHDHVKALKLLGDAQDLARARGIPLINAALALSKAYEGSSTSLSRFGIIVPRVTTATTELKKQHDALVASGVKLDANQKALYKSALDAAKVQDKQATSIKALALAHTVARGQAEAYAHTAAGAYDRTKVSIDELEASIGRKLLPAEEKALTAVQGWVTQLTESNRVQDDAKQAGELLATAFSDIGTVARTVGPPLLEATNDIKNLINATTGIGPIIAFGAAWYSLSKGVHAGSAALSAVERFATPGALAAPGAAGAARGITAAESLPAIMPVQRGPSWSGLGAGGSASSSTAKGLASAEELGVLEREGTAIAGVGAAAEVAAPSLAGFGAGLSSAIFSPAGAVVGVAALAAGIYYLTTETNDAERSAKRTKDAFSELAGSADRWKSATANLKSDRFNVAGDKIGVAQAQAEVTRARAAKSDPQQNLTPEMHTQNLLEYATALHNLKSALMALHGDQAAVKKDLGDQGSASATAAEATSKLADSTRAQADAAGKAAGNLGRYQGLLNNDPSTVTATHFKQAAAELERFTEAVNKQAQGLAKLHPRLSNAATLVGQFAQSQQRVPTKSEIEFIFKHAKADTDIATITKQVQKFDNKKVNTEIQLAGVPAFLGDISNIAHALHGLTGTPWVIPITYATTNTPPPRGGKTGPRAGARPAHAATGAYIDGQYSKDATPVMVTGSEAILNPKQIDLVNGGMTVSQALFVTGAPVIQAWAGYASGANPINAYYASTAGAKPTPKKPAAGSHSAGHGGSKSSTPTDPDKKSNAQYAAEVASFTGKVNPAITAYDRDSNTTNRKQIVKDIDTLLYAYKGRVSTLTGDLAKYKGHKTTIASVQSELQSTYGQISTYRGDLKSLLSPPTVAPGGAAYAKKQAGLERRLTVDQTTANDAHHPKLAAAAKTKIKGDRQRVIDSIQGRIKELQGMRRKSPKRLQGAILAELDALTGTLGGYYNDQSTDDQAGVDAAQTAAEKAAASQFDNTAFQQSVDALNAVIAGDTAALGPNATTSAALQTDQGRLRDLVGGRIGDIGALLARTDINAATRQSANQELAQDYGIVSQLNQALNPAAQPQSADDQAIIAQLQQRADIATRGQGLSDAALRAFGSSGDIGTGGFSSAGQAGAAGPTIIVQTLHPGDPNTLAAVADAANAGNGLQQSISSGRTRVNI